MFQSVVSGVVSVQCVDIHCNLSPPNYKLKAKADGSKKYYDAKFVLQASHLICSYTTNALRDVWGLKTRSAADTNRMPYLAYDSMYQQYFVDDTLPLLFLGPHEDCGCVVMSVSWGTRPGDQFLTLKFVFKENLKFYGEMLTTPENEFLHEFAERIILSNTHVNSRFKTKLREERLKELVVLHVTLPILMPSNKEEAEQIYADIATTLLSNLYYLSGKSHTTFASQQVNFLSGSEYCLRHGSDVYYSKVAHIPKDLRENYHLFAKGYTQEETDLLNKLMFDFISDQVISLYDDSQDKGLMLSIMHAHMSTPGVVQDVVLNTDRFYETDRIALRLPYNESQFTEVLAVPNYAGSMYLDYVHRIPGLVRPRSNGDVKKFSFSTDVYNGTSFNYLTVAVTRLKVCKLDCSIGDCSIPRPTLHMDEWINFDFPPSWASDSHRDSYSNMVHVNRLGYVDVVYIEVILCNKKSYVRGTLKKHELVTRVYALPITDEELYMSSVMTTISHLTGEAIYLDFENKLFSNCTLDRLDVCKTMLKDVHKDSNGFTLEHEWYNPVIDVEKARCSIQEMEATKFHNGLDVLLGKTLVHFRAQLIIPRAEEVEVQAIDPLVFNYHLDFSYEGESRALEIVESRDTINGNKIIDVATSIVPGLMFKRKRTSPDFDLETVDVTPERRPRMR